MNHADSTARKHVTDSASPDAWPTRPRALSSVDVATLARLRALLATGATPLDALLALARRQGTLDSLRADPGV